MALLDVSEILTDPDMVDIFNVRRRMETVDIHGRSTVSETVFPQVIGVVTAISPSDLDRRDDYEAMSRSISVVCKFRLHGETTGNQPDIVVWRGSNYLVRHVDPYPQFGNGFFQAECSSMDKTDPSFDVPIASGLKFNNVANSAFVLLG